MWYKCILNCSRLFCWLSLLQLDSLFFGSTNTWRLHLRIWGVCFHLMNSTSTAGQTVSITIHFLAQFHLLIGMYFTNKKHTVHTVKKVCFQNSSMSRFDYFGRLQVDDLFLECHNSSHKFNGLVFQASLDAWASMYSIWYHLKDELFYYILKVLSISSTLI